MNLLVFTLAVDETHATLGFVVQILRALASRFSSVDVITMYRGPYELPANVRVRSTGRERGWSKPRRITAFYCHALAVLRERTIDVAFVHQIHLFAWLFRPLALRARIPVVMWYAHGAVTPSLRLAHWAVDRVISSTAEGFRIPSDKVKFIGQAVDTDLFRPRPRSATGNVQVVTVGRVAPSKRLELLIRALRQWRRFDWRLKIAGSSTSPDEERYAADLRREHSDDRVLWLGRLEAGAVADLLREGDVFVNLSATGSLDKAILEAMASGCPVLSCNDAFVALAEAAAIEECVVDAEVESILMGLDRLSSLEPNQRSALSNRLRAIAGQHSFGGFVTRLSAELEELAR